MDAQLAKYMKEFRRKLRAELFDEVRLFDEDKFIANRETENDLFSEHMIFDYSRSYPDGAVKAAFMLCNMRYLMPNYNEVLKKTMDKFIDEVGKFNEEQGFTGGENGEFRIISDSGENEDFMRITFFCDIRLSPLALSPDYIGQDELVDMIGEMFDKYDENAKKLYELWLEIGRRSVADKNKNESGENE